MKRPPHKFTYLFISISLLIVVLSLLVINRPTDGMYIQKLNSNFSTEFTGLNNILMKNDFRLTELREASCNVGGPNSGVEGVHFCDTSRNGFLSATPQQIKNWHIASQQIDKYLTDRDWKFSKGLRGDVVYSPLNSMFEASVTGPVVVMYNKQFPKITCRLVFDVNREYPHRKPNQVDVSESCEKNI